MDYPYDLGPYSRTVTTSSVDAQRWFDRGLNWCSVTTTRRRSPVWGRQTICPKLHAKPRAGRPRQRARRSMDKLPAAPRRIAGRLEQECAP